MIVQRRVAWLLALLALTVAALSVTVHTRTIYACVLCRVERTDHNAFGYNWQSLRASVVADWYRQHHGGHAHRWSRASCTRSQNVFGMTTKWACGSHHPICNLPPNIQLRFLESADQSQRRAFFAAMMSDDEDLQQSTIDRVWELAIPEQDQVSVTRAVPQSRLRVTS